MAVTTIADTILNLSGSVADVVAPSGYAVAFTTDPVTITNQSAAAFQMTGAEVGATFDYSITSDGGGTAVTGSGTIATATQNVTGLDVSGLADGTLTVSLTLTNTDANTGAAVTDTVTKDIIALALDFVNGTAEVNGVATVLSSILTVSRNSVATYTDAAGNITSVAANTLRTGDQGLLVEESRTNLALRSEEFDAASWSKSGSSVTGVNTVLAPDGTMTADAVSFPTGGGGTQLWQYASAPIGVPLTCSLWMKSSMPIVMNFGFYDSPVNDTTTVNVTTSWQRFSYTRVSGFSAGGDKRSYWLYTAGVAVGTVDIWGAQLEQGSFATSYIPTAGSTVTRARDDIKITGANFTNWYNANAGTLFADYTTTSASISGARTVAAINTNVADNNFPFRLIARSNGIDYQLASHEAANGGNQFVSIFNTGTTAGNFKIGMAAAANDFAGSINGSAVQTDNSGSVSPATQLQIGANGSAYVMDQGLYRTLTYWPSRKSDAYLQAVTTP